MKRIFGFLIFCLALLSISTVFAHEEYSSDVSSSESTSNSLNIPCTESSVETDGEWVWMPVVMYMPDGNGGFYPTTIYQPTYLPHNKHQDNNSENNCVQKEQSHTVSVTIPILIVVLLVVMVIYSVMW